MFIGVGAIESGAIGAGVDAIGEVASVLAWAFVAYEAVPLKSDQTLSEQNPTNLNALRKRERSP